MGGLIGVADGLIFVLAGYRTLHAPGPSGLLHVTYGAYVALAGGALTALGGVLATGEVRQQPEWTPRTRTLADQTAPWADSPWADGGSVGPPTR